MICFQFFTIIFCFAFKSILHSNDISTVTEQVFEKPLVVIIPSYNNIQWYKNNLDSVLTQKYDNYRVIYINDASNDGLKDALEIYLKEKSEIDYQILDFDTDFSSSIPTVTQAFIDLVNHEKHFFTLVNNLNRCGAMANHYRGVLSCNDDEIVVQLDGDDWLYDDQVLADLNTIYSSEKVWLTHGSFIEYPRGESHWSIPVPDDVIKRNAFREYRCPSHLRTFYSWLFKKIELEDFLYDGQFVPMTCDMAIMFPMLEMAGERHKFISRKIYVYNSFNPINDNKTNALLQQMLDWHLRNNPRYQRLKEENL